MKKFLAIYTGSASAKLKLMDKEASKQREDAGLKAWQSWATEHEQSIIDQGAAVGKTKRISAQGIADATNEIGAYVIVQATSHEAAAKLFEKHPHFMIFPGDAVEIMECMPVPKAVSD